MGAFDFVVSLNDKMDSAVSWFVGKFYKNGSDQEKAKNIFIIPIGLLIIIFFIQVINFSRPRIKPHIENFVKRFKKQ